MQHYKSRFGFDILENREDSEELVGEVRKSSVNEVLPRHLGNPEDYGELITRMDRQHDESKYARLRACSSFAKILAKLGEALVVRFWNLTQNSGA